MSGGFRSRLVEMMRAGYGGVVVETAEVELCEVETVGDAVGRYLGRVVEMEDG